MYYSINGGEAIKVNTAEWDGGERYNRLYDPLAARLRAELWLDRERAGVLMDLGR